MMSLFPDLPKRLPTLTVRVWTDVAWQIERRRPSAARYRAAEVHLALLPQVAINAELDTNRLRHMRQVLTVPGFCICFSQPARGARQSAMQTLIVMAINNQIAKLENRPIGHNRPPEDEG